MFSIQQQPEPYFEKCTHDKVVSINTMKFTPLGMAGSCLSIALPSDGEVNGTKNTEEAKLVHQGDRAAFEGLFQQYKDKIFSYQLSLVGDIEDARDLTQMTFLRVWEKLPTLQDESRFMPWLYKIARNVAYDHWRRKKKALLLPWEDLTEQHGMMSTPSPEEGVLEAELVRLALAELPPKYRECLLRQTIYGFSQEEIAEFVGISKESVRTYLCYARRQFRQAYQRLKHE